MRVPKFALMEYASVLPDNGHLLRGSRALGVRRHEQTERGPESRGKPVRDRPLSQVVSSTSDSGLAVGVPGSFDLRLCARFRAGFIGEGFISVVAAAALQRDV